MPDVVRFFDMFCGAGGSSRGATMAGAVTVGGLDAWKLAADAYSLNFPDATVYRAKASSLSPHRVADEVGKTNLLLASPECTSHSVAKGNAPRCEKSRGTAFEVVRFAKVLKPRWIIVENVVQMKHWARYKEWKLKIESLGYKTNSAVLDSRSYGAPQARRRLFLICDLKREPKFPEPTCQRPLTAASILGRGEPPDTPWQYRPLRAEGRAVATLERADRAINALGANKQFLMVYYGTDGAGGFQQMNRPLRTVTTLDRFAHVRPIESGHEMRMLQPPELAAAMGFPEHHVWPETTRRERIKLIGNAVCPPVMHAVVKSLLEAD